MKKLVVLAIALSLTVSSFADSLGRKIYNRYSDEKDVSAVYISPSMFKMINRLPEMDMGGQNVELTGLIKSLDGFYLIDSRNSSVNASLKSEMDNILSDGSMELMLEAKEEGETVRIYTKSQGETMTHFVLVASEKEECTVVYLEGQLSREQLNAIIGDMNHQ
ncbi:MAG: DUF4252 domain-containing protein [Bacteroidales bacterium]|nr:DUF4252 domain-containing protein [Bacteroidales bacterium]